MNTFAEKVNQFNKELDFTGTLPDGIRVMNPFRENPEILPVSSLFYEKFYNDSEPRKLILGINPGRLGAGATGIPFTDTKRLAAICNIKMESVKTHEPSSVFIYDLIEKYGGAELFYKHFFINSICPLGFIKLNERGKYVNYNYYDDEKLFLAVKPFIIQSLRKQIGFGTDTSVCLVLGKKNAGYLDLINKEEKLFHSIVAFDHPRFIEQYKSKSREKYLEVYLEKLRVPQV
jgi:hypothetical protein